MVGPPLMAFLNKLESRFGWLAIPNLIQFIAGFQLFILLIVLFMPDGSRGAYLSYLLFDGQSVLGGQVWRMVSYVLIPGSFHPLLAIIGASFMMFLGRGLEEAWGAFRVNLYVIGGILTVSLASLVLGYQVTSISFYLTTLFAFATLYPDVEILLMLILPVKMKWVAWLSAAGVGLAIVQNPLGILEWAVMLSNYLVVFGPDFVHGRLRLAKAAKRRESFRDPAEDSFFHQCKVCGKTEKDDPTLEFRVDENGDEICSSCRPRPRAP